MSAAIHTRTCNSGLKRFKLKSWKYSCVHTKCNAVLWWNWLCLDAISSLRWLRVPYGSKVMILQQQSYDPLEMQFFLHVFPGADEFKIVPPLMKSYDNCNWVSLTPPTPTAFSNLLFGLRAMKWESWLMSIMEGKKVSSLKWVPTSFHQATCHSWIHYHYVVLPQEPQSKIGGTATQKKLFSDRKVWRI